MESIKFKDGSEIQINHDTTMTIIGNLAHTAYFNALRHYKYKGTDKQTIEYVKKEAIK